MSRGFGAFPVLEVLDLSYNNLNENVLPGNFFKLETLRALYLGDNDFEFLPPEIRNLKNLQIVSYFYCIIAYAYKYLISRIFQILAWFAGQ